VLHIVDGLGLSGKTRNLVSVVSQIDRRRFSPLVCRLNDEPSPLVSQLDAACVPLYSIPCADGVNAGAALRIVRLVRSVRADVVHCHNPRPMLYGGLAARALGIRATVGFLSAFACQVPDRRYDFLPQPLATISRRNVYRNRISAAAMRYIVAVSASLGLRFCRYNGVPVDKLRVISYGADLRAIDRVTSDAAGTQRRRLGFGAEHIVIGSVGRLVEQKDYPTQLRAFALAVERVPTLRMAIAGAGPLRAPLEQLAVDLGIADRVRFLGHLEAVPALLRSVDIFALSSVFEPFGVVMLEAQAAGLPVVAAAVNEIPDIVANNVTGLLVPPRDAAAMAALFVRLAREPETRERLGRQARIAAQPRTLEAVVKAYEDLYDAA
jgi:glycosyltransferase involved in cell wall biosynthesis